MLIHFFLLRETECERAERQSERENPKQAPPCGAEPDVGLELTKL